MCLPADLDLGYIGTAEFVDARSTPGICHVSRLLRWHAWGTMNPGRRRLLIPGLLLALLVIVVVTAIARRADAQTTPVPPVKAQRVSVISDPRITEASGMAVSLVHPGIAYIVNDSGDVARVFAVDIASGRVVGVTRIEHVAWRDTEAMALWGGRLWVADIGNNVRSRHGGTLYVFPEPGPGNHHLQATAYPITLQGSPVNVEAMSIVRGRLDFYSKEWPAGRAYEITRVLRPDLPNLARITNRVTPAWTTDATATPDGRFILLRGVVVVEVRNAKTWQLVHSDVVPVLKQGETIGLEASGHSYLIGSEGERSPLLRVAFNPKKDDAKAPVDSSVQMRAAHPIRWLFWSHQVLMMKIKTLVPVGLIAAVLAWRRARRRSRPRPPR